MWTRNCCSYQGGTSAVIEAGAMLTLKVGGNFVNINSGGVFIKGTMVMINSGGAAGSGPGANPEAPKAPKEADTRKRAKRLGSSVRCHRRPAELCRVCASIQAVRLEDNVPARHTALHRISGKVRPSNDARNVSGRGRTCRGTSSPALPYVQPPADEAQQPGLLRPHTLQPRPGGRTASARSVRIHSAAGQDAAPPSAAAPPAQLNYIEPASGEVRAASPASPVNYIEPSIAKHRHRLLRRNRRRHQSARSDRTFRERSTRRR
jgi:hypothetical protein